MFHILEKTILGCKLKFFVIVNIVYDEVNCVFKSLDISLIFSDFISAFLDHDLHLLLSSTEVINNETETSIGGVILL